MAHRASLPLPKDELDAEIKVAEALWACARAVRERAKDPDTAITAATWEKSFNRALADIGRAQRRAEKKQTKGGKR